jgi:hypothetical protein
MDQWDCRYGGVLTEKGLVIVERLIAPIGDGVQSYGKICVYEQISWSRHGDYTVEDFVEKPTVSLVPWCMATRANGYMRGHEELLSSADIIDEYTDDGTYVDEKDNGGDNTENEIADMNE